MGLELEYDDGQTPLDEDEKEGILIKTITTRGELNEAEQLNIQEAVEWTLRKKLSQEEILDESFIRELHARMYSAVWKWAGEFRKSDKNIGVDKFQIPVQLRSLLDDCKLWITKNELSNDEVALRFKHRLVSIHCFSNGNGRHSRLMADVIISKIFDTQVFTWSANTLVKEGEARTKYLEALRAADKGEYAPLLTFARS